METVRGRNWTFVLYPDSMDPDYRSILDQLHIQWCESPLHDQDINPGTGEIKKPHIHILLSFEGNKSYDQIVEIGCSVNGVVPPPNEAKIASIRGYVRYLIHLDNPEKFQYERSAIICHGGMDIDGYFSYPAEMQKRYIQEMKAYIQSNTILEYFELLDVAERDHYETWFDLLTTGRQSFIMIKYIDSFRNWFKSKQKENSNI